MGEFFPVGCGSKGFKILKGMAIQGCVCGSHDAAEIDQGFLIHLILAERLHVVAEIAQEPIELPKGPFGRVEPAGEGSALERFGFEHHESNLQESLLRMPAVGGPFDANQEQPFQWPVTILLTGMKTRDMAFHCFTSTGRE